MKTGKNWWWKKFEMIDKGNKRRALFDTSAAAAFYYELARRNFPLKKYPAFTKLNRGEFNIVYHTFGRKFARWNSPAVLIIQDKITSSGDFVAFPSFFWNLRASESALRKTFWQQIEVERNQRGIAESDQSKTGKGAKSRNAGNSARTKGGGQSWRWLELLDNPHGLTSNERSHLSAARKKMSMLKNDFLLLWKEIEQHRAFLEIYDRGIPQALQNPDRKLVKW
jgi:hypothetical protein